MTPTIRQHLLALPDPWKRAMQRAMRDRLEAQRISEHLFVVPSTTRIGALHRLSLQHGKIIHCECPGWRGRTHPCKHAGAVAIALLAESEPRIAA